MWVRAALRRAAQLMAALMFCLVLSVSLKGCGSGARIVAPAFSFTHPDSHAHRNTDSDADCNTHADADTSFRSL
ncbi:hypothetical protein [Synechococcus sp. 'PEA 65AY6A-5F PE A']|uniref:hypothetical protein n=1 Tax=Synechococcus sp. 'PEA 65AY6A-5F PE A' TaxID=1504259 RepID=UPI0039C30718